MSNSPCAGCKFLRRKCTTGCVFAPYFPAEQPQKFAEVHKVFGASNVTKLLNELNVAHREAAVCSLAFEAHHRLNDPVRGCVGLITDLQQRLNHATFSLISAKKELAALIGEPGAGSPVHGLQNVGFNGLALMLLDPQQYHQQLEPTQVQQQRQMVGFEMPYVQNSYQFLEQEHQNNVHLQFDSQLVLQQPAQQTAQRSECVEEKRIGSSSY